MKKIFLSLIVILSCFFTSQAQTVENTIDTVRTMNDTGITGQTRFHGVTHQFEGFILDTIIGLEARIAAMVSSAGGLQTVCNLGDTTTTEIVNNGNSFVAITSIPYYSTMNALGLHNLYGSNTYAYFGVPGGKGGFSLRDNGSGYSGTVVSGILTAARGALLPNEGTGSGLASTFMLHTSKDGFTCTDGTYTGYYYKNLMQTYDASGNSMAAGPSYVQVGTPLVFGDGNLTSLFGNSIRFRQITGASNKDLYLQNTTLTANRSDTLQDGSGYIGLILQPTTVKTTTTTAAPLQLIPCDASAGSFTVTLPATPNDKSIIECKLIDVTGTYSVTINAAGGDVFNKTSGSTSLHLTVKNQVFIVQYDAATAIWYVLDCAAPNTSVGTVTNVTSSDASLLVASGSSTPDVKINYNHVGEWTAIQRFTTNNLFVEGPDPSSGVYFNSQTLTGNTYLINYPAIPPATGQAMVSTNGSNFTFLPVPVINKNRVTGQTAAVASVATYTVGASDASFIISANVNVTTSTTFSFSMTCTYTDEASNSVTFTEGFSQLSGANVVSTLTNSTGAGAYKGLAFHIRAKAGTTITWATTGTFTSVTYNAEGIITQE